MTEKQKTSARRAISILAKLKLISHIGFEGSDFPDNRTTIKINVDTELTTKKKRACKPRTKLTLKEKMAL